MSAVVTNVGGALIVKVTIAEGVAPALYQDLLNIDPKSRRRAKRLVLLAERALEEILPANTTKTHSAGGVVAATRAVEPSSADVPPVDVTQLEDDAAPGSSLISSFKMDGYS